MDGSFQCNPSATRDAAIRNLQEAIGSNLSPYRALIVFEQILAPDVYGKDVEECGAAIAYPNNSGGSRTDLPHEVADSLKRLLIHKAARRDSQTLRLADSSLLIALKKVQPKNPIFVYRHGDPAEEANERATLSEFMHGEDLEKALEDYKQALFLGDRKFHGGEIDRALARGPSVLSVVALFEGHIFLLTKITPKDGNAFVVLMNSENEEDDSFKAAKTGAVINRLVNAMLGKV